MNTKMESNDMIAYNVGGLVDGQGSPVPGGHVTGFEVQFQDGTDASSVADLVPGSTIDSNGHVAPATDSDVVVKSKDVTGTIVVIAHTANASGSPGGDQTDVLEIGDPNIAPGALKAGTPVAREN